MEQKGIVYGKKGFMTEQDVLSRNRLMEDEEFCNNIILGNDVYQSVNCTKSELHNILVVGAAGTGKDYSYITPNLLQMNSSYVVVNLCNQHDGVKEFLKENGYKVHTLNLCDLEQSDKFNPLKYIRSGAFFESVVKELLLGVNQNEAFWRQAMSTLCKSIIVYLVQTQDNCTFADLIELIDSIAKNPNKLNEIKEALADTVIYEDFTNMTKNTEIALIQSCAYELIDLLTPFVNVTSEDEMDLDKIGYEKTAIFIDINSFDERNLFLARLLISQAYQILFTQGNERRDKGESSKADIPVHFVLDEFANLGIISILEVALATANTYNITTSILVQSIEQIKNLYGDSTNALIANCNTILLLCGCFDYETVSWASTRLGTTRYFLMEKPICTIDELMALTNNECIVMHRGHRPILTTKFRAHEHSEYGKINM